MGSCLIELQSFSLSELQIAPTNGILVNYPRIFEHRDSGFVQIVLNFFQILIGVHRVHGCQTLTACLNCSSTSIELGNTGNVLKK